MKVVYLNVKDGKQPEIIDIPDELETFYKLIKCDTIDIVRRKIGGKEYHIICDDEGLFDQPAIPSLINHNYGVDLVGNLIICNCDEQGELQSLTDVEAERIINQTYLSINFENQIEHYILKQR